MVQILQELWYSKCMIEETAPRRRGRPATGVTPKRNVRVSDDIWGAGEELAARLGVTMTAYVIEALTRHNAKVERDLKRSHPPQEE